MRPCIKYFACTVVAVFVGAHGMFAQTPAAPKKDDTQRLIANFPVPVGEGANGIWIPDWENGKDKMSFYVAEMEHKDLENIQMTNAKIITYDDNKKVDLILLLPVAVFDLRTRLLSTDKPFVLKRTDLELIGDSLELDTLARQAKIKGNVKMIIYNFQEPAKKETAHE